MKSLYLVRYSPAYLWLPNILSGLRKEQASLTKRLMPWFTPFHGYPLRNIATPSALIQIAFTAGPQGQRGKGTWTANTIDRA